MGKCQLGSSHQQRTRAVAITDITHKDLRCAASHCRATLKKQAALKPSAALRLQDETEDRS